MTEYWCKRKKRENNTLDFFSSSAGWSSSKPKVRHDKTDRQRERDSNEVALVDVQDGSNLQICFGERKMSLTGKWLVLQRT
jgi:hypothetical protein